MVCASCRAILPDGARFCASCGCPAESDALTMGASQATESSPGGFTRRTSPAATELLSGGRSTVGVILQGVPYALRNVLFNFFLLFLLRVVLGRQWLAAAAFVGLFALLGVVGDDGNPWVNAVVTVIYFGSGAVVVLRWGLLPYAVGVFVGELLLKVPATLDSSAWYFGNMLTVMAVAVALASWGLYTVVPRSASSRMPA
jgi:hypothetical protein